MPTLSEPDDDAFDFTVRDAEDGGSRVTEEDKDWILLDSFPVPTGDDQPDGDNDSIWMDAGYPGRR